MIDPAAIGARLAAIIPGQEALTGKGRASTGSADSFSDYSLPHCRRRPLTMNEELWSNVLLDQKWWRFDVYQPARAPVVGDKLVDAAGVVYQVMRMRSRVVHGVYICFAMQSK